MEWTRSETLALALESCTHCHGLGLRWSKGDVTRPCNCVLRAIFRACYRHFRYCASKEKYLSRVSLDHNSHSCRRNVWGRKDEEYVADFYLVSRRSLNRQEFSIFRLHYLYGADWKLCCRKLNLDRGTFFHSIYRIEAKLGRIFRELRPFALFPVDEYFSGILSEQQTKKPAAANVIAFRRPLRAPVKAVGAPLRPLAA